MTPKKLTVNYSIENIAQSIVRDHPVSKKYSAEDKLQLYQKTHKLLDGFPELKKLLSLEHIRSIRLPFAKRISRCGILPPAIVIVDSRIQDMCSLPYWLFYGSGEGTFGKCSGVGNFSCCPPFTPSADKVQELLNQSDIFCVLQTRPSISMNPENPGAQFHLLNKLADEVNTLCGRKAVIQKFAGGPCFACYPEACLGEGKCRAPALKIASLEGMGVCVDQLCKDLAFLTADDQWKIVWIKGFSADTQKPKTWKGTMALAIQLIEHKANSQ